MDFKQLIKRYGVEFVMNRMDIETYQELAIWFEDEGETM